MTWRDDVDPAEATRRLLFRVDSIPSTEEQFDIQELIVEVLLEGVDHIDMWEEEGGMMIELVFTANGALDLDPEADRYALQEELGEQVNIVEDEILD